MKDGFLRINHYLLIFSVIGLVIIQLIFIQKERELTIFQFKSSVMQALGNVENKIETQELLNILKRHNNKKLRHLLAANNISIDFFTDSVPVKNRKRLMQQYFDLLQYHFVTTPINDLIDTLQLRKTLDAEFAKQGLHFPYEYAVLSGRHVTGIASRRFNALESDKIIIRYPLFKDLLSEPYDLVISVDRSYISGGAFTMLKVLGLVFITILITIYLLTVLQAFKHQQLVEMKNDFINNITHEFKTPIATINLVIDSMKNPVVLHDPERLKEYLDIIKKENKHLLDQVEKILFLGKLEQNKILWRKEKVDIYEIIENAIDQVEILLKKHNGDIEVDFDAEKTEVTGDPLFLLNMFVNLLDNAIKYSRNKPKIKIKTFNKNNFIVIKIKDNGVGMSKQVQNRIFEKFYRKPTGDLHSVRGHGIGLSFVKQVVDRMNGHIYVESEPGQGTEFTIYLPLAGITEQETLNQTSKSK